MNNIFRSCYTVMIFGDTKHYDLDFDVDFRIVLDISCTLISIFEKNFIVYIVVSSKPLKCDHFIFRATERFKHFFYTLGFRTSLNMFVCL